MRKIIFALIIIFNAACSQKIVPKGEREQQLNAEEARGQTVFMQRCSRCHPGGMAGLGPAVVNKPLPGFLIKFQVRHGLGVMPSFDKKSISDEDLKNLISWIKKQ
jgi:mono/diheme cytochrome c family protein